MPTTVLPARQPPPYLHTRQKHKNTKKTKTQKDEKTKRQKDKKIASNLKISNVPMTLTNDRIVVRVTRPEHPKGAKDEVK